LWDPDNKCTCSCDSISSICILLFDMLYFWHYTYTRVLIFLTFHVQPITELSFIGIFTCSMSLSQSSRPKVVVWNALTPLRAEGINL
jgi:hypothetical protein